MARRGRGWHGESGRHALAARKGAERNRLWAPAKERVWKLVEDELVRKATAAKTDKEYAQLLDAADQIGSLRETARIMGVKQGEMSGPSGRMPIIDIKMRRGKKASWTDFRKILRNMEDANMLPPWHWTLKDYYEDYLDSGLSVKAYTLNLKEQLRLGPNGDAVYGKRQ